MRFFVFFNLSRERFFRRCRFPAVGILLLTSVFTVAAAPNYYVYFGTYTGGPSRGIYVAKFDASSGSLSAPELAATNQNPTFLALNASSQRLYAAAEATNAAGKNCGAILAYSVDAQTGKLAFINQQASHGEQFCHLQVSPQNRAILAASYDGGSVSAFPLNANGSLQPCSSQVQHHGSSINPANQKGPHAHCINCVPNSPLILVCDLGLDQILEYSLDSKTCGLVPYDPPFLSVTPGSGPRHLAFHPNGRFIYMVAEMGCTVTIFSYSEYNNAIFPIQTNTLLPEDVSLKPALTGSEIAVHPSGNFLYSSVRGSDLINVFHINSETGMLTHQENVASGGKVPRFFALDPTGHFLLVANQKSSNVQVFEVDQANGRLTPTGAPCNIGNPTCAVFVPNNGAN